MHPLDLQRRRPRPDQGPHRGGHRNPGGAGDIATQRRSTAGVGNDPRLRHLDHAWASTVHAFQGDTVDNMVAAFEGIGEIWREALYRRPEAGKERGRGRITARNQTSGQLGMTGKYLRMSWPRRPNRRQRGDIGVSAIRRMREAAHLLAEAGERPMIRPTSLSPNTISVRLHMSENEHRQAATFKAAA